MKSERKLSFFSKLKTLLDTTCTNKKNSECAIKKEWQYSN